MKSLKILGFVTALLTVIPTLAQSGDAVVDRMLGVYSVGACDLYAFRNAQKVAVNLGVGFHKEPMLQMVSYGPDSRDSLSVRLGSGVDSSTSSGGTETWSTVTSGGDTLTITETYERRGSEIWPDLGYSTTISFVLRNGVMQVESVTKRLYGHAKDDSSSCTLTSLKGNADQIEASFVDQVSPEFEALAPQLGNADYDQSTLQFERMKLNQTPSKTQIQEVVGSLILPQATDFKEIEVTQFTKASNGRSFAERAMATLLGFAKDFTNEAESPEEKAELEKSYAPLYRYVDQLADYLDHKPAKVKVYLLQWNASDSDGSAVLIIDTETNEAVYIGAYYFS